ncbi:GlsB/YeaQ/YmgE family stress response membrane protein [Neisseria sicca]|uniref:GlsB/YeaQ/YmgE family stress response membrane protein n=1 Tax=Neisseria sicca TaxID=490 RepID=UPI0011BCFDD5|nr:GlsB/YeaQ/YmgE family stress response membrane protein [Neisseria sicca]
MGWIVRIIMGLMVGGLGKLVDGGKENLGLIMRSVLGIGGWGLGGFVGEKLGWYEVGEGGGWIA